MSKERNDSTLKKKNPLLFNFVQFLRNVKKLVRDDWVFLSINKSLKEICQTEPTTAFRRNKNLKELIGSNKVEYGKVKKQNIKMKRGKYSSCLVNNKTPCLKKTVFFFNL